MIQKSTWARWGAAAASALLLAVSVTFLAPAASAQSTKPAVILVVDMERVLNESVAAKDIQRQLKAMGEDIAKEFDGKNAAFRQEGESLATQQSLLTPEAYQTKIQELQQKGQGIRRAFDERMASAQAGAARARSRITDALRPILADLLKEKGGNIMLDQRFVLVADVDLNVTSEVIQRLDQAVSSVTVTPVPIEELRQQQQPQN